MNFSDGSCPTGISLESDSYLIGGRPSGGAVAQSGIGLKGGSCLIVDEPSKRQLPNQG